MPNTVIYIGENWTLVDNAEDAVLVKVIGENGRLTFGIPSKAGVKTQHMGEGGRDHPSGSPQSVHGKPGEGAQKTGEIKMMGGMLGKLMEEGGFSVSLDGKSPTSGWMTAVSDKTEKKKLTSEMSKNDIMIYARKNYVGLQAKDAYLGGWLNKDKETGESYSYLDVSINFQDRAETIRVARQSNQLGIFDVKGFYTIMLDDPGGKLYRWEDDTETVKIWID